MDIWEWWCRRSAGLARGEVDIPDGSQALVGIDCPVADTFYHSSIDRPT